MFDKKHFLGNCDVDHRLVGVSPMLSPFAANDSSQRLSMFSSHLPQAVVLDESEPPEIATGYENIIGEYEFDPTVREVDGQILAYIPKYIPNKGVSPIKENPAITIIYKRNDNNKVDYFTITKYTKGSDGYGYKNVIMNEMQLMPNNYIGKDVKFQTSKSHIKEMYSMGINAKTAYMSLDAITEDAFVMSESLAKKMGSLAIRTISFGINEDYLPINLYGNDTEYKFFPDIGEKIRNDAIICGFRKPDAMSFVLDTAPNSLTNIYPLYDQLYFAKGVDATIIDVTIHINKKVRVPQLFQQVLKYKEQDMRYHNAVVSTYYEIKNLGYGLTDSFNTFVTRSLALLIANGKKVQGFARKPNISLIQKKDPIPFLHMSITYAYNVNISSGYKFTDRHGGKGVTCEIRSDDEMPVDEYGVRADLIMDVASVINRMNSGQWYEQFISRTSLFMQFRLKALLSGIDITKPFTFLLEDGSVSSPIPPMSKDVKYTNAYDLILTYIRDINFKYAELIEKTIQNEQDVYDFVDRMVNDKIYLIIPPFLEHINTKWVLDIHRKYPAPKTPVRFVTTKLDGSKKIDISKNPIMIGSKYIYCLYKMPEVKASGPGYVNQSKTPIRPSDKAKMLYPIMQTPLRSGEDEIRNQCMGAGPVVAARFMGLYANSPEGVNALMTELITSPSPTNIDRVPIDTATLVKTNAINKICQHLFSTLGIDITQTVDTNDPRYFIKEMIENKSDVC